MQPELEALRCVLSAVIVAAMFSILLFYKDAWYLARQGEQQCSKS